MVIGLVVCLTNVSFAKAGIELLGGYFDSSNNFEEIKGYASLYIYAPTTCTIDNAWAKFGILLSY